MKMHKIKDTSTTPLRADVCIPDYPCLDTCQLKRNVRDAKKIELPE